ncbi:MAG TPA: hypothetical protein VEW73_12870 [Nocardioides sp.]|nr:hypothetical protein [Nocardioides sp.]
MSTPLSSPKCTSTITSLRRSGARTRFGALVAAGVVLGAGLTGCGSDGGDDTASDPAASSSTPSPADDTTTETPTETSAPESGSGGQETIEAVGSADVTEATLLSATEGGGSPSTLAMALDTDQARADFVAQLEGGFADTVSAAAAQAAQQAPGSTPYGAIAAVGCDAPRGVAIDAGEAGFEVVPRLPENGVQCLAPVTYVVLFTVPDA